MWSCACHLLQRYVNECVIVVMGSCRFENLPVLSTACAFFFTLTLSVLQFINTSFSFGGLVRYAADTREWGYMGPVWHGGQAIKALISAADAIPSARMLGYSGPLNPKPWVAGAELGAAFTLRQRIRSGADMGLILSCENACCTTQTSTMLEGMHGLMVLGNHTSNITYTAAATSAAVWALRTLSVPNEPGLMYDGYNQATGEWLPLKWNTITPDGIGRPMNDDSVFLRASKTPPEMVGPSSVDAVRLRQAFYEVLDRLIQSEGPPGNWGGYVPCSGVNGTMHPRQAFWWGMPFIEAFRDTGNTTYLAVAQRSAEWCVAV